MVLERQRAAERGYPSPIHNTIDDTHASYDLWVPWFLGYWVVGWAGACWGERCILGDSRGWCGKGVQQRM